MTNPTELVFLGTGVSSGFPAWFCNCDMCTQTREDPTQWRSRSSIALLGNQTTIIDASPDISFQLNREHISKVHNVLLTHWHQDHIHGLGYLGEAIMLLGLGSINLYLPEGDVQYFNRQMHYVENYFDLHPITQGKNFQVDGTTFEPVKTRHTPSSTGYIVNAGKRFAYFLDTGYPPQETIERLKGIDLLIVEATLDFVEGEAAKRAFAGHMSLESALKLWREIDCPECILTHFSCHGVKGNIGENPIVQSFSQTERLEYEENNPGLTLAYDGMRVSF
ncbi:MAG: MBL fold metallo-hydrolase [Candidatus Thorarchaeota archaeon]